MKKLLLFLSLLIAISFSATSQTRFFLQPTVSAGKDKVLNENLEAGFQAGSNRVSFVGQTFNAADSDRQYLIGVKYAKAASLIPSVNALFSLAGKTNVSDISQYVIEPGLGLEFSPINHFAFVGGITSPIAQTSFDSKKLSFSGNAGVKLTF